MSTGRRLAYVVPVSHERHESESLDFAVMVIVATLVIAAVVALCDPLIFRTITHLLGTAWAALVALFAQR
jgi:hypothetical protein